MKNCRMERARRTPTVFQMKLASKRCILSMVFGVYDILNCNHLAVVL